MILAAAGIAGGKLFPFCKGCQPQCWLDFYWIRLERPLVPGRILIVDDERDITSVMSRGLKSHGFEVAAFVDPIEALLEYKPGSYDLAILDYKMPGINGIALYKKIRKMDGKVKICFLSAAEEMLDLAGEIPDLGACIMKKPMRIADLVHRINAALRGARAA